MVLNKSENINMGSLNKATPSKMLSQDADSIIGIFKNLFERMFVNPFSSLAEGNILGIVFFAILIGIALLKLSEQSPRIKELIDEGNKLLEVALTWIIKITPLGIVGIVFDFSSKVDSSIFTGVLSFCLVVFGATLVHGLIVLPAIAYFFGNTTPVELFHKGLKPLFVALTTSSSSATLPVSMETAEKEFKVKKSVSSFVFPLGATMNMDGTALYEGIAAVFLAHLYGIDLSTTATLSIFLMSMISSIGAPGIPSASMAGMQMVLLAAGIPLEAIGILILIDKPLDTFRTAVNVEGDLVGAIVTNRFAEKTT